MSGADMQGVCGKGRVRAKGWTKRAKAAEAVAVPARKKAGAPLYLPLGVRRRPGPARHTVTRQAVDAGIALGSRGLAALKVQCLAVVTEPVVVGARAALVGGNLTTRRISAVVVMHSIRSWLLLLVDGVERWCF